jgi:hypothetical protein
MHKSERQRCQWNQQQASLRRTEAELQHLHGNTLLSQDAWIQRRIGLQRKLDRVRSAVRLPPVAWLQANAADRAVRRRT